MLSTLSIFLNITITGYIYRNALNKGSEIRLTNFINNEWIKSAQ